MHFNGTIYLGQLLWSSIRLYLLTLTTSTADQTLLFFQENCHLTMQWFPLDLRLTTAEQCPCLALSVRMTGAKKNLSNAKSSPTQCTHRAHILSSSHQCTLFKSNNTQPWSLFKHHITLLKKHSFNEWSEMIKVKSSLIEWTTPKQLPSTLNLWTLLRKTHLVAHVYVLSRVTRGTRWPSAKWEVKSYGHDLNILNMLTFRLLFSFCS